MSEMYPRADVLIRHVDATHDEPPVGHVLITGAVMGLCAERGLCLRQRSGPRSRARDLWLDPEVLWIPRWPARELELISSSCHIDARGFEHWVGGRWSAERVRVHLFVPVWLVRALGLATVRGGEPLVAGKV